MTKLGIIEGYFGRSWSWDDRKHVVKRLAAAGYSFFHYAPKIDAKLRREWQQPYSASEVGTLRSFGEFCRSNGMRFGVGLTPFGAHLDFSAAVSEALRRKLAQLDEAGIDELAILFDDMDGDIPDLANRQAEIVGFATSCSRATAYFTCPSYYSDDPLLDRVFGTRPAGYLADLGRTIDPAVSIYWTGEEVCSLEVSAGHLGDVADQLGRRPALWDNYPVNDGPRMSKFLHLRAFSGRRPDIADQLSHHAINPASQAVLGCIPALTLPQAYALGSDYRYARAFLDAAEQVCGAELATMLLSNLLTFNDVGLDGLSDELKAKLKVRYAAIDHPAAHEVADWLDGGYAISGEMLRTQ